MIAALDEAVASRRGNDVKLLCGDNNSRTDVMLQNYARRRLYDVECVVHDRAKPSALVRRATELVAFVAKPPGSPACRRAIDAARRRHIRIVRVRYESSASVLNERRKSQDLNGDGTDEAASCGCGGRRRRHRHGR